MLPTMTRGKKILPNLRAGKNKKMLTSVWFFPSIVLLSLIILTCLRISGTSVGVYNSIFYGNNTHNSSLLLNNPQPIRSDEWLVNTQLTIAQKAADFPLINHNLMGGTNMSLVGDVPYLDWSMIFHPQNLAFFILPLDFAFAFKWWLLLFLVIVGIYFVILRFLPNKKLFAALMSLSLSLSPFIFWWYQTSTTAPIFYGCFIFLIGLRIINGEKIHLFGKKIERHSTIIYVLTLAYLITSFALVLYPPFQIPIAIVIVLLLLARLLEKYGLNKKLISKERLSQYATFVSGGLIALALILSFIQTRSTAYKSVLDTAYPGNRIVLSGNTPLYQILATDLQAQLERDSRSAHYYTNQSEASDFILFLPFLLIPGFVLIYIEYRRFHKINWSLISIQMCGLLFLAFLYIPGLQLLDKITLLDRVPHARLFIGLGFAGIFQLLLIVKSIDKLQIDKKILTPIIGLYCLICLGCIGWADKVVSTQYPQFIHSFPLMLFFGLFFIAILFCLLTRRLIIGSVLLLLFSAGCVYRINPLYIGLEPLQSNQVFQVIDNVSKPSDTWVGLDDIYFENFALMSNRKSISGVQLIPNLTLWNQVEGKKYSYIYNRYAHVEFSTTPSSDAKLDLAAPDNFVVQFSCSKFIETHVQYALSIQSIDYACTKLIDKVYYPDLTLYIYKVN